MTDNEIRVEHHTTYRCGGFEIVMDEDGNAKICGGKMTQIWTLSRIQMDSLARLFAHIYPQPTRCDHEEAEQ